MTLELDLLSLLILSLATFRISRLLVADVILDSLRNKIWEKRPPHTHKIGYLFTCPWCISIWIALTLVICYTIVPTATVIVALPFALSAVAGLISTNLDR